MEIPVLGDKNVYPSHEVINSHIGKHEILWNSFFDFIHNEYAGMTEEWRYYNDGKSWLFKAQHKKKTIFWLSLYEKSFRATFYFTDKANDIIKKSSISDDLKKSFNEGKYYGKIRGLTVNFKKKKDVEDAKELIKIKLTLK